jgi:hypothetical protein
MLSDQLIPDVNGKDYCAARDVKKAIVTQYGVGEVVGSVTDPFHPKQT